MGMIAVRFTDEEEKEIKKNAKILNISVSDFLRRKIFSGVSENDFLAYRMDLKNGIESMIEVMNSVLVQARMGNRLNGEILYKLSPSDAVEIVQNVKKRYIEEQKEG